MSSTPPDEDLLPRSAREAWRADIASPAELRRGYARFMQKRSPRRAAPRVAAFVAAGLVLGLGLAQAASLAPAGWFGMHKALPVAPSAAPLPVRPLAVEQRAAPAEAPMAAPAEPAPVAVSSPSAQQPALSALVPQPSLPVQEQWQRAAAALRDRDFGRARAALVEIERSAPGAERDAARLARAQLLESHGHRADALTLVEGLAQSAESQQVRGKALELVQQWREKDRSGAPAAATKIP